MAKNQRGSQLNNVQETWNENERRAGAGAKAEPVANNEELNEVVKDEAADYDRMHEGEEMRGSDE